MRRPMSSLIFKSSVKMVCVRQINCHKSIASTEQVSRYRAGDLILMQEPNTVHMRSLKRKGKLICAPGLYRRIRSAIFVNNPALDVTALQQFTTPDMATAQVEGQSTIFCSLYLDINLPVWPTHLQELINFCSNKNKKLFSAFHFLAWAIRHKLRQEGIRRRRHWQCCWKVKDTDKTDGVHWSDHLVLQTECTSKSSVPIAAIGREKEEIFLRLQKRPNLQK